MSDFVRIFNFSKILVHFLPVFSGHFYEGSELVNNLGKGNLGECIKLSTRCTKLRLDILFLSRFFSPKKEEKPDDVLVLVDRK